MTRRRNEEGHLLRERTDYILITGMGTANGESKTDKQILTHEQFEGRMGYGSHYYINVDGDALKGRQHDTWSVMHPSIDDATVLIKLVGTDQFNEAQIAGANGVARWLQQHYPDAEVCWDVFGQEKEYLSEVE